MPKTYTDLFWSAGKLNCRKDCLKGPWSGRRWKKHWYILRYIAGFCPNWGQSIGLVEYVICNISKYLKYKIVVLPGEWSTPEIL